MKLTLNKDHMTSLAWVMLAVCTMATMVPMDALAATGTTTDGSGTALSAVLCAVVSWFQGPIGAGIATLAIIVIGVGALMGKVSWGMAIIVGLGVGVIFGAPSIVKSLGGATACGTTTFSGLST
ncbi:MAG: TrbC/VirB2 family protein [Pseudomonadota bacterium]